MIKKLLITSLFSIYGVVAHAQYNGPLAQPPSSSEFGNTTITSSTNRAELLNQNMNFAVQLGAAASRCATLSEVILQGWPQARMSMVQEMVESGHSQAEASFNIDRAFQSARHAPESANLIKDCDSVLNEMYKFQARH